MQQEPQRHSAYYDAPQEIWRIITDVASPDVKAETYGRERNKDYSNDTACAEGRPLKQLPDPPGQQQIGKKPKAAHPTPNPDYEMVGEGVSFDVKRERKRKTGPQDSIQAD
jgi:hypothetical protein